MYLNHRLTRLSDLEACYPFVRDRFRYGENVQKTVLALWRTLLNDGCCISQVIEDIDQPEGKRLVGFGMSLLATDRFVEDVKTHLPPFLHLRVLEKWRKGIRPFLKKEEVAKAQAGQGLNVVALHYGWDRKRYDRENFIKIRQFFAQAVLASITGYRVKEFMEEVYDPEEKEIITNLGCDTYRDYAEFLGTRHLPKTVGKNHPYLMGVTLGEARKKVGTSAAAIALLGSPRFRFQASEQEVLRQALADETDEEIAKALGVSLMAVKKRWQGIYDKVEGVDAALLADSQKEDGKKGKTPQRRRRLLRNLRNHPEELWPVPGASGKN
jgi:DNA-binding CsgD family transcriptional regulator